MSVKDQDYHSGVAGSNYLADMIRDQATTMNAAQLASYEAGIAEGFRRGRQAAADACEEYRTQLEANGTHLVAIAARTCANRIRALQPKP